VVLACVQFPRLKYFSDLFPLAVIASFAVLTVIRAEQGVSANQDFQLLSQTIDARAGPNELLIFYNESGWVSPGVWYMGYKYYSPRSHHPWATLDQAPDSIFRRRLASRQTFWLIGPAPERYGAALFPGWQPEVVWHTSAGGICLMRKIAQPDYVR
jgi:hypothetical protein